jgi:gas vesicle protein
MNQQDHNFNVLSESNPDNANKGLPSSLTLAVEVTDPEIIQEILYRADGPEREKYILAALRLGVLSLRFASGNLDSETIRNAGDKLVADMKDILNDRTNELNYQLSTALTQYFDPATGLLAQRIQSLVQKDGELERILQTHIGSDDSVLAKSLAKHIGQDSPLFLMLSPTDGNGLRAQMAKTLEQALFEQREKVLREFSLDNRESALSRLVTELTEKHKDLGAGLKEKIDEVVKEFSLDHPNSALSRLVARVELAQRSITEQFSSDNDQSALNKLSKLLQNTSDQISSNLTLDNDQSALSRLKREIQITLEDMVKSNTDFHTDVKTTLAALHARKQEADRSTRHGNSFEEDLGSVLALEAQRVGDLHEPTGNTTGAIKNSKKGDHLITLGPETPAPGVRIIWEAKEDKSYALKDALAEIEEARKNRQAQIGVFVFSQKTAPASLQPFTRYGHDIILIWDADDPASVVYIKAAYSVTKAMALRESAESKETLEALQHIELSTRQVEKQIQYLDDFRRWGETVKGHGEKIVDRADRVKKELANEVERLDDQIRALKAAKLLDPGDYAF